MEVNWSKALGKLAPALCDTPPPSPGLVPEGLSLTDWVDGELRRRMALLDLVMDLSGSTEKVHGAITDLEVKCREGVIEAAGESGAASILAGTHALSQVLQWSGKYSVLATAKPYHDFVSRGATPIGLMFDELIRRNLAVREVTANKGCSISSVTWLLITDFGDTSGDLNALKVSMQRTAEYVKKFNVKITAVVPTPFDESMVAFIRELNGKVHFLGEIADPTKLIEIVVQTASQTSVDLNLAKR